MLNHPAAFLAGLVFALGLGISGMTLPERVLGFLDVAGAWDPSLAFVMAGAVGANFLVIFIGRRMHAPGIAAASALRAGGENIPQAIPQRRWAAFREPRLILGSATFGVGWGLVGICPGPAIVSFASGLNKFWVFMASMLVGVIVYRYAPPLWQYLTGKSAVKLTSPPPEEECGTV